MTLLGIVIVGIIHALNFQTLWNITVFAQFYLIPLPPFLKWKLSVCHDKVKMRIWKNSNLTQGSKVSSMTIDMWLQMIQIAVELLPEHRKYSCIFCYTKVSLVKEVIKLLIFLTCVWMSLKNTSRHMGSWPVDGKSSDWHSQQLFPRQYPFGLPVPWLHDHCS